MNEHEDVDARLTRLAAETSGLRPRPGFEARVLFALERETRPNFQRSVALSARRVMSVAALLALGALSWALQSEHSANLSMASDFDPVEIEW